MKNITISATKLKENISEILNTVHFKGSTAIIKRHGKPIAKIIPVNKSGNGNIALDLEKILDNYYGIMPDLPLVTKSRKFSNRKISL